MGVIPSKVITAILLSFFVLLCWFFMCRGEQEPKDILDHRVDNIEQVSTVNTARENTEILVKKSYNSTEDLAEKLIKRTASDPDFRNTLNLWSQSESQIRNLEREFHRLIHKNDNLFNQLASRIQLTKDPETRQRLEAALYRVSDEHELHFRDTQFAIDNLWELHDEAVNSVHAMQVAYTLGEFSNVNASLADLKKKIIVVMSNLNDVIKSSRSLFEQDMAQFE